MIRTLERYCEKCGYKVNQQEDKFCPSCGQAVPRAEEVPLSEYEAKDIPIVGKSPVDELREKNQQAATNLWLAGSYYLVIIANALTIILVALKVVNPFFLPVVLLITLSGIAVFGAFRLQIDSNNCKKSFVQLMVLSLQNFLQHNIEPNQTKNQ